MQRVNDVKACAENGLRGAETALARPPDADTQGRLATQGLALVWVAAVDGRGVGVGWLSSGSRVDARQAAEGLKERVRVGAKIGTRQLLGAVGEASIDLRVRRRKKGEIMLATVITSCLKMQTAARTFAQDKQWCS